MRTALCILLSVALVGCASVPYSTPAVCDEGDRMPLRAGETQIEHGRPNVWVDSLRHYLLSLPGKIMLLSWRVDAYAVSEETELALVEYLETNNLCHVKVRINQYRVGGEWSRLFRNRNINGFWRYTFGLLSVLFYTIFPGRAFGGDNYNPFTNTINIYSDIDSVALHEGGHAKDWATRKRLRGFYAALRILPLVPLYQEAWATSDALGYLRHRELVSEERAAYPMLWGAYGTYVGGEALRFWDPPIGISYLFQVSVAWTGKLAGFVKGLTIRPAAPRAVVGGVELELEPADSTALPER